MRDNTAPRLVPVSTLLLARSGDIGDVRFRDSALLGYFCDCLSDPAPGRRFLARQIRYLSGELLTPPARTLDLGDLNVFPLEPKKHAEAMERQLSLLFAAGARPCLVGGDKSGLDAIRRWMTKRSEVAPDLVVAGESGHARAKTPLIVAVDLSLLAGRWLSRPRRLAGLSPHQIISALEAIEQPIAAAAIFGLAPALDASGVAETRAARDVLSALVGAMQRGDR